MHSVTDSKTDREMTLSRAVRSAKKLLTGLAFLLKMIVSLTFEILLHHIN